eukprot:m.516743 g.516743  ORF g.516743 m.516743 type:complete len:458 (+) comp57478_c0_seq2:2-1375(+)
MLPWTSVPFTPLGISVWRNNISTTKSLLARSANPSEAIEWALIGGRAEMLALLRASGAKLDISQAMLNESLCIAAKQGAIRGIKYLLSLGAALDGGQTKGSMQPLYLALSNRHEDACLALIDAGAHLWSRSAPSTPLTKATTGRMTHVVQRLLQLGVNVDEKNEPGLTTPLTELCSSYSIQSADIEILQLLIDAGANIELAASRESNTPLMLASHRGHVSIVRKLLSSGAQLEARNEQNGYTAFAIAITANQLETAQALVSAGANVDTVTTAGVSPLMIATRGCKLKTMEFLVGCGASLLPDQTKMTPLDFVRASMRQQPAFWTQADALLQRHAENLAKRGDATKGALRGPAVASASGDQEVSLSEGPNLLLVTAPAVPAVRSTCRSLLDVLCCLLNNSFLAGLYAQEIPSPLVSPATDSRPAPTTEPATKPKPAETAFVMPSLALTLEDLDLGEPK